tara:strand:+ start:24 stop:1055 length:1032 start_codon:yes stop_codon:yes gene_type:complete
MLVLLQGWNYVMELYFWLILGAILLVSLTILLARPQRSKYEDEILDLGEAKGEEKESDGIDVPKAKIQKEDEEEDDKVVVFPDEYTPEELKKQWSIAFSFGGLTFTMFGGMVLWIGDGDFSKFLGSSMIYVGILSLLKGISFQISERIIIRAILPILIFGINFFLLDVLLGVIGQYAWMVQSDSRKAGDLLLVYVLPYLLWRIVPSFSKEKETRSVNGFNSKLYHLLPLNIVLVFFTYLIFWITNTVSSQYDSFDYPVLRQYAKVGLDFGIDFLPVSLGLRLISSLSKSRFEEDVPEDDVDYEKKESTPADLEEEGRAIRDFSEENEDEYFAEEFDNLEGEEE